MAQRKNYDIWLLRWVELYRAWTASSDLEMKLRTITGRVRVYGR